MHIGSLGSVLPSEGTGTTLEAMCMSDAGVRSLESMVRQLRGWRGRQRRRESSQHGYFSDPPS